MAREDKSKIVEQGVYSSSIDQRITDYCNIKLLFYVELLTQMENTARQVEIVYE
jgi:hypothetical protein